MHPELKRLASNVSQWPAGYKWVRSDSSVQMMTMSRNDDVPDDVYHWFSYQEWYQARRTLDFPLPSGRVEVAPPLPDESSAPDFQKFGIHPNLERIAREVSDWDDSFNFLYVDAEHGNIMRTFFRNPDHFLYDKETWQAAREYLVSTGKMSVNDAMGNTKPVIEVGKRYIDGNYLIYVIAEHHFKPGFYFASENTEGAKVQVISGEYLEPVSDEIVTLIELTGSVKVAKKIIEAGYKRG